MINFFKKINEWLKNMMLDDVDKPTIVDLDQERALCQPARQTYAARKKCAATREAQNAWGCLSRKLSANWHKRG